MNRALLPPRRASDAFDFEHNGHVFRIQAGFYPGSEAVGEIFINYQKTDSSLEALGGDIAILLSLLLQHGASLHAIGHALRRNPNGSPASLIGCLTKRLAELFGGAAAPVAVIHDGLEVRLPQADARVDVAYQHLKAGGFLVSKDLLAMALSRAFQAELRAREVETVPT